MRMLDSLQLNQDSIERYPTHQGRNINKCPKCKCEKVNSTGNLTSYPDHWERFNCNNCGWLVGLVDNSPYISCYEYEDFVIDF